MIEEILHKIQSEPFETSEIVDYIRKNNPTATRTKILYRLHNLRGEGKIHGKLIGSGKGSWIWWS